MNAQTVVLLQELVRRESLSLLTYIGEAFPWTTSRGADALLRLKQIVTAHNEAVAALGRYLTKLRQPLVYLGSYPSNFTTLNFLTLDYILTKLVEAEQKSVAALEQDYATLLDADGRVQVEKLLSVKKKQLESLELLAAAHTKTTPVMATS